MCSLPWEKRFGTISAVNVAAYLENVRFGLFALSDCGRRSTALVHNPTQIDQSVPHYARGITWEQVDSSARFHFTWNGNTDEHCVDGQGCDSFNHIMVRDMDGSLLGTAGEFAAGPNPTNLFSEPTCTSRFNWTGFECAPTPRIVRGHLEAVEPGRVRMGGLMITRRVDPADNTTWRATASYGSIKDMCAKRPQQPLYAHNVAVGMQTNMMWGATEPAQLRYRFFSTTPSDAAVISMFISRPYSWSLFVDGREVPMLEAANSTHFPMPQVGDPAGTWVYRSSEKQLWFTVRGTPGGGATWYDLVQKPTVQLNLHLAVTVEQFFGSSLVTNLALLLGIESWRIKIVDVRPGSSMVRVEITDSQPPVVLASSNDTTTIAAATAQFERMQTIAQQVQTMATTGSLATVGGYTVLSVAITPPVSAAVPESAVDTPPAPIVPTAAARAGLSPGAIAGIVFGSLFGVLIVAGVGLMYRRARNGDRSRLLTGKPAGRATMVAPGDGVELDRTNPQWARGGLAVVPTAAANVAARSSPRPLSVPRAFSPLGTRVTSGSRMGGGASVATGAGAHV
jgi:hypothetical protein